MQPKTSGVIDVNGVDIKDGDNILVTINPVLGGSKIISEKIVKYDRGAFRAFYLDGRESCCIGDYAYNCDLEVLI